jgi:hypothetical protein
LLRLRQQKKPDRTTWWREEQEGPPLFGKTPNNTALDIMQ